MSSETTVTPAEPSPEQRQLTQRQVELAEFQLTELQRQRVQQEKFAAELEPLFEQQAEDATRARERAERLDPIQEELLTIALEDLRRGGKATPEQIELIDEATQAGLNRGLIDVERFETQGLEAIREELAPSLGLRPSDTPILDRGGRLGAEALRQRGSLTESFGLANAQARLNFPLASSSLLQSSTLGQQQLTEATRQFQDTLRNQAFSNRLNLASTLGGLGLGLATGFNVPQPSFPRGQTSTTSGGGLTSGIGAVGGLLTGLGAIGFNPFSSSELKEDKAPVDDDAVLEGVSRLPVETWRYREGFGLDTAKRHVGTYAEDFRETFGLGDGKTLDMIDTTGVTMSAIKALDRKIKVLEMERKPNGAFGLKEAA